MICQSQITLLYKCEARLEDLACDPSHLYSKERSNSNGHSEKKNCHTSFKLGNYKLWVNFKGFWLTVGLFCTLSTFCKYSAFVVTPIVIQKKKRNRVTFLTSLEITKHTFATKGFGLQWVYFVRHQLFYKYSAFVLREGCQFHFHFIKKITVTVVFILFLSRWHNVKLMTHNDFLSMIT